ncbi:MAG: flippase activity-associated protein Agl23 [Halanaeroarchaeum sp.]
MRVPELNRDRTTVAVLAIALLGLAVRLLSLGWRVFHWDEARVGYWILRYGETGVWSYRPIVHGPFLFHVNEVVFDVLGPTDFAARLVVAVVGAVLPAGALLFRYRLDPVETITLATFLAFNPVLVYYSRFMRNDVLAAAFAFAAVGAFVRLADTGRQRYLYGGTAALALAATTKEIVVVYVAVWVGALFLLLDHRLVTARFRDEDWVVVIGDYARTALDRVRTWALPIYLAVLEFLLVIVVFYAPRPDLYQALGDPGRLLPVVESATVGTWRALWGTWIAGGHEHSYVAFLLADVRRIGATSATIVVFAALGFAVNRYGRGDTRDLVTFGSVWAVAMFLAYPAITDISAPWGLVHPIVPLAIPAAVGAGYAIRIGHRAVRDRDRLRSVLVTAILLVGALNVGVVVCDTSFDSPQASDNPLVQYGQPASHLQQTLADVARIAAANEGTDVLFYGEHFYVTNESAPLEGPNWTNRFPLPWYLERAHAVTNSTKRPAGLADPPPVVIARAKHYSTVNERLEGYDALAYELTAPNTETIFFVEQSALRDPSSKKSP